MTTGETATDRRLWQITGADALTFLQGLVSNDVLPLAKGPGLVWAALLTPQGRQKLPGPPPMLFQKA